MNEPKMKRKIMKSWPPLNLTAKTPANWNRARISPRDLVLHVTCYNSRKTTQAGVWRFCFGWWHPFSCQCYKFETFKSFPFIDHFHLTTLEGNYCVKNIRCCFASMLHFRHYLDLMYSCFSFLIQKNKQNLTGKCWPLDPFRWFCLSLFISLRYN